MFIHFRLKGLASAWRVALRWGGQTQQLPAAGLAQGAYWLRYQAPDGTTGTLPLTIEP